MKDVPENIPKWILKAEHDLVAAKQILLLETAPTDTVCYHAQQTVEKIDERQLLLPVNDNYNSRFITSYENSTLRVLERQRKQKEPVGRLAFPLPCKHFTYATA